MTAKVTLAAPIMMAFLPIKGSTLAVETIALRAGKRHFMQKAESQVELLGHRNLHRSPRRSQNEQVVPVFRCGMILWK
jgi:hypothetical protein